MLPHELDIVCQGCPENPEPLKVMDVFGILFTYEHMCLFYVPYMLPMSSRNLTMGKATNCDGIRCVRLIKPPLKEYIKDRVDSPCIDYDNNAPQILLRPQWSC